MKIQTFQLNVKLLSNLKEMASKESQTAETPDPLIGTTIKNKYKILKVLGTGSFGIVYEAIDKTNGMGVAIKLENDKTSEELKRLVKNELEVLQILIESDGIPKLLDQEIINNKDMIVMELLGPDISNLFKQFSKKFSLKTIFMLGEQMIDRTMIVHQKLLIHRDLKPENFLIGLKGDDRKKIYLTDFGLTKKYFDKESDKHLASTLTENLSGTVRYCSVNVHNRQTMSRRDDLESIAYILIYLLMGSLPWDGWKSTQSNLFYDDVRVKKETILENQISEQIPEVIKELLKYSRQLKYEDTPDYNHLKQMFFKQQIEYKFVWDYNYDWILTQK